MPPIKIYKYTDSILCRYVDIYVSTWNLYPSFIIPPFAFRPLPPHLLPPRPLGHCRRRRRRLPPSPSPSPPRRLRRLRCRHDRCFRCYCCCFLVNCCLPPLLPLFPSAAAVLSCPRRCHRCCLVAANTTASPVPSAVIAAAAAAARRRPPPSPSPPSPLPPRSPFPLIADIAAVFCLIVVCPRLPLFRSPSPP